MSGIFVCYDNLTLPHVAEEKRRNESTLCADAEMRSFGRIIMKGGIAVYCRDRAEPTFYVGNYGQKGKKQREPKLRERVCQCVNPFCFCNF